MSNEQEQIDRERYNAEAEEAYRAEVEEDTPRMAERTDRQAQIDPLLEAFDAGQEAAGRGESVAANPYPAGDSWGVPLAHQYWHDGHLLMTAKALLWERDAQIASLTAQLAECYRLSGADPDGNEDWRLASEPPSSRASDVLGDMDSVGPLLHAPGKPVSPVEPEPPAKCDVCFTAAHCHRHRRCLAECMPDDLKPTGAPAPCVWRDISTTQPAVDDIVLVYEEGHIGKALLDASGRWLDVEAGRDDAWFSVPPSHWMPFPTPPLTVER